MLQTLKPDCLPLLIGSIPMNGPCGGLPPDHGAYAGHSGVGPAAGFPGGGHGFQFLPGMPAVAEKGGKTFIDTDAESFDAELLAFFEDYMAVTEAPDRLPGSRFALTETTGKGVAALLDTLDRWKPRPWPSRGR
jgi:hypothetical protein